MIDKIKLAISGGPIPILKAILRRITGKTQNW